MKCILRHILFITSTVVIALMHVSCSNEANMEADMTVTRNKVMLVLNTEIIGESRTTSDELLDYEKMHTLRIVILHSDGTENTVEHNLLVDFKRTTRESYTRILEVKPNEKKTIYLIANEKSVEKLANGTLDKYNEGSKLFKEEVDNLAFTANTLDGKKPIPMSSVYEVDLTASGEKCKEYQFYLVRAATKFTFCFTNNRMEEVTINSISVSDIANKMFLIPHKKSPTMIFDDSKLFWINWLKEIADESQQHPDNQNLAEKRGWIMDYNIPNDVTSEEVTISPPEDVTIPALTYDASIPKSGEAIFPPFYLPESKNLKDNQNQDGEQKYTMTIQLTDANKKMYTFKRDFDNLKALFRNTHVLVNVTLRGKTDISVDVRPYSEVILQPEFGLDDNKK